MNKNKTTIRTTTGLPNVYYESIRNKYKVEINIDGKRKFIGRFKTDTEANEAAIKWRGKT